MSERQVFCGDHQVEVKRFLRPNVEVVTGTMVPFLVAVEDAEMMRAKPACMLRDGDNEWNLSIISVEKTGTDGVWVSGRIEQPFQAKPTLRVQPNRERRGTLMGGPMAALHDEESVPEGDAGATMPLGILPQFDDED